MKWILLLFLLNGLAHAQDLELLRQKSLEAFAKDFGPGAGEITWEMNPSDCLRTGYQRSTGKVVFCGGPRVISGGRASVDVIHHEFFHALFCGQRPELCANPENDYLNEALADAFSFRMNPDEYFGENFYVDRPYIRKYQTDWIPELVQSDHEKGSAIAAGIIRSGKPLSEFLGLFEKAPVSFVKVSVSGAEASTLNRYRLLPGLVLKLSFQFDSSVRVEKLMWETPAGVEVKTTNLSSTVVLTEAFNGGKSFVRFLSPAGNELGRWTFYFGRKL